MVAALAQYAADLNVVSPSGTCPLIEAVRGGHADTVRALVKGGADPDGKGPLPADTSADSSWRKCGAFGSTCKSGKPSRAPIGPGDVPDGRYVTPLHAAITEVRGCNHFPVRSSHSRPISLFPRPANQSHLPESILQLPSSRRRCPSVTRHLLHTRDPSARSLTPHSSPPQPKSVRDAEVIAFLLLNSGAATELRDLSGNTALHLAAARGMSDLVETLVSKGASAGAVNDRGRTALHAAAEGDQALCALVLVAAGCPLEQRDYPETQPTFFESLAVSVGLQAEAQGKSAADVGKGALLPKLSLSLSLTSYHALSKTHPQCPPRPTPLR